MAFPDPSSQQYYPGPTGPGFSSSGTERPFMENIPQARTDTTPRASLNAQDTVRFPESRAGDILKGIGGLVDTMVKATDSVIKDKVQKEVYSAADRVRSEFGVEDAVQIAASGQVLPSAKAADGSDVPLPVKKLGQQVQSLHDALESGHLSTSYYAAKMEAEVRRIRDMFPGYREEIDKEVSRITGMTPANTLRSELQRDAIELQKKTAGKASEYEKFLMSNAAYLPPGYQTMDQGEVKSFVIDQKRYEHMDEQARKPMLTATGVDGRPRTPAQRQEIGEVQFGIAADAKVSQVFEKGAEGLMPPVALRKLILDQQAGRAPKWTPEEKDKIRGQLDFYEKTIRAQIDWVGLKPHMEGKPYNFRSDINDPKKYNDRVELALKPIKELKDLVMNEQWGAFASTAATIKHRKDDKMAQLLSSEEFLTAAAVRQELGEVGMNAWMTRQDANGKFPISSVSRAISNTMLPIRAADPTGAKRLVDEFKRRAELRYGNSPTDMKATLGMYLSAATDEKIKNERPASERANILMATYNGMEEIIEKGYITNQKEREGFVATVFNPAITKGIEELKTTKPDLWAKYYDTATRVFTGTYYASIGEAQSVVDNQRYKVKIDEKTGQLVPEFSGEWAGTRGNQAPVDAEFKLRPLNTAIMYMKPVWEAQGLNMKQGLESIGLDFSEKKEAPAAPAPANRRPDGGRDKIRQDYQKRQKSSMSLEGPEEIISETITRTGDSEQAFAAVLGNP